MKVLGKRVLVEQKMTEKKSLLIVPDNVTQEEKFDFKFTVLQLGDECPTDLLKVGDSPVFAKYVQFHATKVVKKDAKEMIVHVIVHYDDIAAIDNEEDGEKLALKE